MAVFRFFFNLFCLKYTLTQKITLVDEKLRIGNGI